MKLDAVFVLSPGEPPSSMPTRRALLIAMGSFAAGTALGGACGYSMATEKASSTPENAAAVADAAGPRPTAPAGEIELKPSGDAELDYWRKLAVKAPLDDLFAELQPFLSARIRNYQKDEAMWQGVARLATEMATNPNRALREMDVFAVISHITSQARPDSPSLRDLLPQLKALREAAKKRR